MVAMVDIVEAIQGAARAGLDGRPLDKTTRKTSKAIVVAANSRSVSLGCKRGIRSNDAMQHPARGALERASDRLREHSDGMIGGR
jgi:tRNA(Arg) A34 adenosine deaminase TadA